MPVSRLTLSPAERAALERYSQTGPDQGQLARRAQALLLLADGRTYAEVSAAVGWSSATVAKWKARFRQSSVAGLWGQHRGSARVVTGEVEERILAVKSQATADGRSRWSTRRVARHLGLSHSLVARVWRRATGPPALVHPDDGSRYPDGEPRMADVEGLYVHWPSCVAVFAIDGDAGDETRQGGLALARALAAPAGSAIVPRVSGGELVKFLSTILVHRPSAEVHVTLHCEGAHRTKQAQSLFSTHRGLRLHVAPTSDRWLAHVYAWLAKIERDLVVAGHFDHLDLARTVRWHLMRRVDPFRWIQSATPL